MARRVTKSVLRERGFTGMSTLNFEEVVKEVRSQCPTVYKILSQMVQLCIDPDKKKAPLALIYGGLKTAVKHITVSHPMNCVARKMWGIHDAVRAHKARRHFRFSLTSIPNIPKRDLYGCPSRP